MNRIVLLALAVTLLAAPAYAADAPPKPTVEELTKQVADLKAQLTTANQSLASTQVLARAVQAQRNAEADTSATCAAALYAAQQPAK